MKAEIKSNDGFKFPVLMKSKNSDKIVLFRAERSGAVVFSDEHPQDLGRYSDGWISCMDNSVWEKFNGEIVLSND